MKQNTVMTHAARRALYFAAIAATLGGAAAQADLYGGGATLPASGYIGVSNALSTNRFSTTTDNASLFGRNRTVNTVVTNYCQTGSGTGRRVLQGTTGFSADGTCGLFSGTPTGFGAPSLQTDPDFAASDVPLSQTEYSNGCAATGG